MLFISLIASWLISSFYFNRNINSFKLGKLIEKDPLDVLQVAQDLTNDVYTDEFQILTDEAIELVCMEYDIDARIMD